WVDRRLVGGRLLSCASPLASKTRARPTRCDDLLPAIRMAMSVIGPVADLLLRLQRPVLKTGQLAPGARAYAASVSATGRRMMSAIALISLMPPAVCQPTINVSWSRPARALAMIS